MEKLEYKQELPKLPKGDGTLRYAHGGKILYRKSIPMNDGYKRLAVTGATLKDCFNAMQRKEAEVRAGLKTTTNETLTVAMQNWLEVYKQPEVKPSSYDRLHITFTSQIQQMDIAGRVWKKIETDDLQQAVNALVEKNYSWSTIKKAYDMLNAFYKFQTQRGCLLRNPMEQCKMPARENVLRPEKEIVYMSEQQVREFSKEALSYAYGSSKLKYRYGPAFVFLIYTGLRVGELCALQWRDITGACELTIRRSRSCASGQIVESDTKSHRERIVTIPLGIWELLMALRQQQVLHSGVPDREQPIFTDPDGHVPHPDTFTRHLRKLYKQCGLSEDYHLHTLRHFYATYLLQEGASKQVAASLLGHADTAFLERTYCHPQDVAKQHAAKLMQDLLNNQNPCYVAFMKNKNRKAKKAG